MRFKEIRGVDKIVIKRCQPKHAEKYVACSLV